MAGPELTYPTELLDLVRSELASDHTAYEMLPGEVRLMRLPRVTHMNGWNAFWRMSGRDSVDDTRKLGRYRRVVFGEDGTPRVEYSGQRW